MASEQTDKPVLQLTKDERNDLRSVFEGAGYKVSFHRGYMRVRKQGYQEDISYAKIRQYESSVVRRK